MSQRFIRCRHCGFPHDGRDVVCPTTGKTIRSESRPDQKAVTPPPPAAQQGRPAAPAQARPAAQGPKPVPGRPAAPKAAPATPKVGATSPSSRRSSGALIGKSIGGRYLVRSRLGVGGMGTVYEAEHIALGRSVAVKVLHSALALKTDAVRRFQQEARAAGAIGHPNICGVIDLGSLDDGSPYMVMERLTGETLADRVASERGLPFDDVVDILVQVLSALIAAHDQRILHRDIKPENVFLTARVGCPPLVKLLDFGVSKVMGDPASDPRDDLSLTRTGMVMGTPYYMAPEQARGERTIDARVDLYACGVIMYESLTGKRPFTADNYNALLVQILQGTPRPARDLRPALPASYQAVIEKAMARRREDRYASAAEFQRELHRLRDRPGVPFAPSYAAHRERPSEAAAELPAEQASVRRARVAEVAPTSAEVPASGGNGSETGLFPVDPTEVHRRPEPPEDIPIPVDADDDGGEDTTQLMAPRKPRQR